MSNKNIFLGTNIKFLRNRMKISQEALAKDLGMTRGKLNSYENTLRNNLPAENLIRVSDYFKISIDSLLKLKLDKLSELKLRDLEAGNDVYMTGTQIRVLASTVTANNQERIEIIPLKAKAGYLNGYSDPLFIQKLSAFSLPILSSQKKYRMFQIDGDSMLPIPSGAFVIAEYLQNWKEIKDGTPVVIISKEEGMAFKNIIKDFSDKKRFQLHSLNTAYKPYSVLVSDVLEIWKFVSYINTEFPEPLNGMDFVAIQLSAIQESIAKIYRP